MSNQVLIITLLSDDQPGIVQQLAQVISDHQGNWLESRMAQLAGKFAGILKVTIDSSHTDALTQALKQLSGDGIQILIDNATEIEKTQGSMLTFELVGADRVGIVNEISQAFAAKNINIDEMETQCSSMPWSGEPLFEAKGKLLAPAGIDTEELLDQLDIIEEKLAVDITISTTL